LFNFVENFILFMEIFNEKQIQILLIAEKLFASKGYDGASIRDISKEASVNVAMISYYFGSKEKLLESLIVFRTRDLKIKLESLSQTSQSSLEKITQFVQFYIEKIDCNRDMYHIMQFEISNQKRAMDFEAFNEIKKFNLQTLTTIIRKGQDENVFRKDVNIALIIPTIIGTYFYFRMNKAYFSDTLGLDSEEKHENYIKNELTNHIQQTIKSLLLYEIANN
jgi:AcrR family transcriptional regulator